MKRYLLFSDGSYLEGEAFGAAGVSVGEIVFNTGMTGYQEVLSDPSYAGQHVTMSYPLIGNYGINPDDFESDRVQVSGFIVKEVCDEPSNWRSSMTLHQLLAERGTIGISGLDTRKLVKIIRSGGVKMAAICDDLEAGKSALSASADYGSIDYVSRVTTPEPYRWGPSGKEPLDSEGFGDRPTLAVLDCGLKFNILRRFWRAGCQPVVVPASTSADEIMALNPDGILLSPGPGDPQRLEGVIGTVQKLLGQRPIFGICLGNQLLCHAVGGRTYKLKFGHRGSNHSVIDLETGKVTITSQNHGYAVDAESLAGTAAKVTQLNVNDQSVEGISVPGADASSIQYHPEAAPGPWDSRPYFQEFVDKLRYVD